MSKIIEFPVTFILSTGRTGTQFFSRYITESCHDMLCLHEPHPSRRFKWYSNLYLTGRIAPGFVARQYLKCRKKVINRSDFARYVESSNFMFGSIPAIEKAVPELSVIHLVREPVSYIRSHLNKGFWSGIKGFTARNVPGWLEFLEPEILKSNDPVMILAARWIYVNRVIRNYRERYPYLLLKFEDLFSDDEQKGVETLDKLREFLQCPALTENQQKYWLKQPANKAKGHHAEKYPIQQKHLDYLETNGSDLLKEYDYKPVK